MDNFTSVPPPAPPPIPIPPQIFSDKPIIQTQKRSISGKLIIIVVFVFLIFFLLGVGYYFLILKKADTNNLTLPTSTGTPSLAPTTASTTITTSVNDANTKTQSAVANDRRRASIKELLQPALALYLAENKVYPDTLDELVPKYLTKMPLDPATQQKYLYTVSVDKQSYTLSATLDDGSKFSVSSP